VQEGVPVRAIALFVARTCPVLQGRAQAVPPIGRTAAAWGTDRWTIARWAQITLYTCAGAHLVGAAALPGNLEQLGYAEDYQRATGEQVLINASPQGAGLGFELLTWFAASIVFLFFFHRAYSNLRRLAPAEQRWSSGWAIGWWFIPFFSLVRPKQMANDIWRGCGRPQIPAIFNWWWAFWILANIASGFAWGGMEEGQLTVAQSRMAGYAMAAGELTVAVAAVIAAVAVKRLADAQRARADHVTAARRNTFFAAPEAPQPGF